MFNNELSFLAARSVFIIENWNMLERKMTQDVENYCTTVTVLSKQKRKGYTLVLFGAPVNEEIHDDKKLLQFAEQSIVAYLRVDYVRQNKQFCIVVFRTLSPGKLAQKIPGVSPGGEILLNVYGRRKCEQVLECINILKKRGITLNKVPSEMFPLIQSRIDVNVPLKMLMERIIEKQKI